MLANIAGYNGWYDVIGSPIIDANGSGYQPSGYEMFGANLRGNILSLFTNWKGGHGDRIDAIVETAAIFFDEGCNGTWDKAINLNFDMTNNYNKALTATTYLSGLSYRTSNGVFGGATSNYVYGGKFDPANPQDIPTQIISATSTGTTTVTWYFHSSATGASGDPGSPFYEIDIDLTPLNLTGPYSFIWGSGTCANDTIQGCVPVPGAVLLFGSRFVPFNGLWQAEAGFLIRQQQGIMAVHCCLTDNEV